MHGGVVEADSCGLRCWDLFAVDVEGADEEFGLLCGRCSGDLRHIGFPEKKVCVSLEVGEKLVGWHPLPVGNLMMRFQAWKLETAKDSLLGREASEHPTNVCKECEPTLKRRSQQSNEFGILQQ